MNISANNQSAASSSAKPCYFCESVGDHKHYTVKVYELGTNKFLGRLGIDGTAVNRNLFAVVYSNAQANLVASEINSDGEFIARVSLF